MDKKSEISFLNTVFCLIVILIHVLSEPVSKLLRDSREYAAVFFPWRLSAFVVQGFIFLSALKMFLPRRKEQSGYPAYFAGRVKKIIIPYIAAVCLFYGCFLYKGGYFEFNFFDLIKYILNGTLVSHFYFVIVIVQFYLLKPVWEKTIKNVGALWGILISLVVTLVCKSFLPNIAEAVMGKEFIYNDRIFTTYLIYWVAGCYAGANYDRFKQFIDEHTVLICVVFAVIAAAEGALSYFRFTGKMNVLYLEQIHMVYCCAAIAFCYAVALKFGSGAMRYSVFKVVNKSSYYIYLIHPLLILIVNDKIGVLGQGKALLIRAAFTYCGSILICGGYVRIKEMMDKK